MPGAILAYPDLDVVRFKNSRARAYPSAASAGYRDVGLQLRLASAAVLADTRGGTCASCCSCCR